MPGFANVGALVDAELAGQSRYTTFRKLMGATGNGLFYDYSMAPGNPSPQYYAATPLAAKALSKSADGGIQHGGDVSPMTKHLRRLTAMAVGATTVPQRLYLLDYLLFYPFFAMATAEPQVTSNAQALTRYVDGSGVQMMAVIVAPHSALGDTFSVTYTNQAGVAGRVTPLHGMQNSTAANGLLLTTQSGGVGRFGPFMALQAGDSGVRSIQSAQCSAGTDIGLFTLVLVRPLAEITVREITAPAEVDFFLDHGGKLPAIVDDAYLNLITCPTANMSGNSLNGDALFVWN